MMVGAFVIHIYPNGNQSSLGIMKILSFWGVTKTVTAALCEYGEGKKDFFNLEDLVEVKVH